MTTITTVGYGDISGSTKTEKVFCIWIQVIGVVSFSIASGSLASIITSYDTKNAKLVARLQKLKKMYKDYCLPIELYGKIRQSITVNYGFDDDEDLF